MHEVTIQDIQSTILTLPGRPPFMVTKQLADLYETNSERVLQAYRRNLKKFPEDFVFQLTKEEAKTLQSEGSLVYLGGALPYGFYRNGCNMLSAVLQGDVADDRSIQIMRAFSAKEEMASGGNQAIEAKMVNLLEETNALQRELITHLRRQLGDAESKIVRRRNFTPDEDAQVIKLHRQGMTPNEIGKAIGRKKGSIRSCLGRLKRAGIYSWEVN